LSRASLEYIEQLDRMDRRETPSSLRQTARLTERIATLKDEMSRLEGLKARTESHQTARCRSPIHISNPTPMRRLSFSET